MSFDLERVNTVRNNLLVGDDVSRADVIVCDTSFFLQYSLDFIQFLDSSKLLYTTKSVKKELESITNDNFDQRSSFANVALDTLNLVFEKKILNIHSYVDKNEPFRSEKHLLQTLEKSTTHNLVNSLFLDSFSDMYFNLTTMKSSLIRNGFSEDQTKTFMTNLFFTDKDHFSSAYSKGIINEYVGVKTWYHEIEVKLNNFEELVSQNISKLNGYFEERLFNKERGPINLEILSRSNFKQIVADSTNKIDVHDSRKRFIYDGCKNKNSELLICATVALPLINPSVNKFGIYTNNKDLMELNILRKYFTPTN